MVRVHGFPHPLGIQRSAVKKVGGGEAIILAEIVDHLTQGSQLVKKLQTVGEEHMVQQAAHPR